MVLKEYEVRPQHGLRKTLALMRELELKSIGIPDFVSFVFREFDSLCSPCLPGKLYNFVRKNFVYADDAPHDEVITAPHAILDTKRGDCDDFALFIKTCFDLLSHSGWIAHYCLLGQNKNEWTHIIVFAHRGLVGGKYRDPVYVDGASEIFNYLPSKYKWMKIL